MHKASTWLLVANSNRALIYDVSHHSNLDALRDHLITSFNFPEGRLKNPELGSDEPGRYRSGAGPKSAFAPDTDPHQVELEHFSRQIADYLLAEHTAHHYESLIICAEPHFLGIVRAYLPKAVHNSVKNTIDKDYIPMIDSSSNDFISQLKKVFL